MKKRYYLVLPLMAILSGCTYGSYSMIGGSMKKSDSQIKADYKKFNGYIVRKFKAKENTTYTFTFNCAQKEGNEGSLKLVVDGFNSTTIENIVYLDEPLIFSWPATEKFEVKISASNHSGNFDLSWIANTN